MSKEQPICEFTQLNYNKQFQIKNLQGHDQAIISDSGSTEKQTVLLQLLANSKQVINIPQIQRMQRLRIDQTQQQCENTMLNHISEYLTKIQSQNDKQIKIQSKTIQKQTKELFQRGKAIQVWYRITAFLNQQIQTKFNEIIALMDKNKLSQDQQGLKEIVSFWHQQCQLHNKLLIDFQSLEYQVQKDQRIKAQMRNEQIGLNRSGMQTTDKPEAAEETTPNRLLQMRNRQTVDQESQNIAHKCSTIYEIVQCCIYSILNNTEKGKKLLSIAIEDSLQIIQKYRVSFLETQPQDSDIVLVRSFVKLLSTCSGGMAPNEEISHHLTKQKTLYIEVFENKFIQRTQQFYQKYAGKLMKDLNIDQYIKKVDLIFEKEDELMEQYFDNASFSLNNSCIYEFMIKNCHEEILKSGLPSLLNERKYDSLMLLYSYMHDTELLTQMRDAWSSYIYDRGNYYLKGLKSSRESIMEVIGQIIDLKILSDTVIEDCFLSNISLRNAQIQSFQEFFNKQGQQAQMAQILSLYIDCILRKDFESIYEKQQNEAAALIEFPAKNDSYKTRSENTLVYLFRFLQAKEIFIQKYLDYLSDRLLNDLSHGGPHKELEFSCLFKHECGDNFASQTEQIIDDVKAKVDLSQTFNSISKKKKQGQHFEFLILDSQKWPIKNTEYITSFPRQLKEVFEEFTQLYEQKKRGSSFDQKKKDKQQVIMQWNIQYGDCELQTYTLSDPEKKLFVINMSCMLGVILLSAFQAKENKKSIADIQKLTGISNAEIIKSIEILVKVGVLCESSSPHKYQLNENFNEGYKESQISLLPDIKTLQLEDLRKLESLNLSSISGDASIEQSSTELLQQKFMETLKFRIDSRIIKNLKQKKSMKMADLIEQVIHDLSLQIKVQQNEQQIQETTTLIGKRVQDLASREYVKSDGTNVTYIPV